MENKQEVINKLADIYDSMGYISVARAIRNGDQAKENAMFALNLFRRSLVSSRRNPETGRVTHPSKEKLASAHELCDAIVTMINKVL